MSKLEPNYNEFYDPRLVAIYNTICPLDGYEQFYFKLAKKLNVKKILDIGCGTGLLTIEFAKRGYHMIGVEPSQLMLDVAIRNSQGLDIEWIHGNARSLKEFNADMTIMTGHVAQFYLEDEEWQNALKSIYDALKSGGYLAFESRNPDVQPWNDKNQENNTDWYAPNFHKTFYDPKEGEIVCRSKRREANGQRVTSESEYLITKTGEKLTSANTLIFRTREDIEESLKNTGFSVEAVYGNWNESIASKESHEFIFVAKRN